MELEVRNQDRKICGMAPIFQKLNHNSKSLIGHRRNYRGNEKYLELNENEHEYKMP